MKTRTQGLLAGMLNRMNRVRMLDNDKGFTLIELMIVIAIIGILAAVAIPNFIEYKNKSYCTATVADVGAIKGALADYFANPANVTASVAYNPASAFNPAVQGRPFILVGANAIHLYTANTLLLSGSTTMPGEAPSIPTAAGIGGAAAGAFKVGSNFVAYAYEGAGNCPEDIISSDTHWVNDPISQTPCTNSYCCHFSTM